MTAERTPRPWMCPACPPHLKALHHPERGCDRCDCRERHPEGERFLIGSRPQHVSIHDRSAD